MPRVPFGDLPGSARVWIFASARRLDSPERERLLSSVDGFLDGWAAHGVPLTGARELRFARFLVVGVDEFAAPPSGCSIDALVRVFKVLQREFGMGLLDRAPVWYRGGKGDDEIECVSRAEFRARVQAGEVGEGTVVFDNTVTRMDSFRSGEWEKPAGDSWHGRVFFPAL